MFELLAKMEVFAAASAEWGLDLDNESFYKIHAVTGEAVGKDDDFEYRVEMQGTQAMVLDGDMWIPLSSLLQEHENVHFEVPIEGGTVLMRGRSYKKLAGDHWLVWEDRAWIAGLMALTASQPTPIHETCHQLRQQWVRRLEMLGVPHQVHLHAASSGKGSSRPACTPRSGNEASSSTFALVAELFLLIRGYTKWGRLMKGVAKEFLQNLLKTALGGQACSFMVKVGRSRTSPKGSLGLQSEENCEKAELVLSADGRIVEQHCQHPRWRPLGAKPAPGYGGGPLLVDIVTNMSAKEDFLSQIVNNIGRTVEQWACKLEPLAGQLVQKRCQKREQICRALCLDPMQAEAG